MPRLSVCLGRDGPLPAAQARQLSPCRVLRVAASLNPLRPSLRPPVARFLVALRALPDGSPLETPFPTIPAKSTTSLSPPPSSVPPFFQYSLLGLPPLRPHQRCLFTAHPHHLADSRHLLKGSEKLFFQKTISMFEMSLTLDSFSETPEDYLRNPSPPNPEVHSLTRMTSPRRIMNWLKYKKSDLLNASMQNHII